MDGFGEERGRIMTMSASATPLARATLAETG